MSISLFNFHVYDVLINHFANKNAVNYHIYCIIYQTELLYYKIAIVRFNSGKQNNKNPTNDINTAIDNIALKNLTILMKKNTNI